MARQRSARRYEVWLVELNPAIGAEIAKTRPCVIVSPDELNRRLKTVIIAPATSVVRGWAHRVAVRIGNRDGEIALDQLRAVDKARLVQRVGILSADESKRTSEKLVEMFAH